MAVVTLLRTDGSHQFLVISVTQLIGANFVISWCAGQNVPFLALCDDSEKSNLDVVHAICDALDEERPSENGSYKQQIKFVLDRPGHDRRYAINAAKMRQTLGWRPSESFESGLRKTARWYLDNSTWTENVVAGSYSDRLDQNYSAR